MADELVNKFRHSVELIRNFAATLPAIADSAWTEEFAVKQQHQLNILWENHEQLEEAINGIDSSELNITSEEMTDVEEEYRRIQGLIDQHISIWKQPEASSTINQRKVSILDNTFQYDDPLDTVTTEQTPATSSTTNFHSSSSDTTPKYASNSFQAHQSTPHSNSSTNTAQSQVQHQLASYGYNYEPQFLQSGMQGGQYLAQPASTMPTFSYTVPNSLPTV